MNRITFAVKSAIGLRLMGYRRWCLHKRFSNGGEWPQEVVVTGIRHSVE